MLFALLMYFVVLAVIGIIYRKTTSGDEFLLTRSSKGWFLVGMSLFTLIGGGELATLTTLSYIYGFSGIYLFVGFCVGFISLIFLVDRMRESLDKNLYHSLPDYFYEKYGKASGLLVTVLSFIAFLSLLVIQFSAGAQIVSAISGWSYLSSVGSIASIVLFYLLLGGFKSVLATDMIQGIAMIVLLPLVLWGVSSIESVSLQHSLQQEQISIFSIASFVFTGLFVVLASSDIWQRVYAAKNSKHAKLGLMLAAVLFLLFGFGIASLGVFASNGLPGIDPNNAFVQSVTTLLPTWAASFVVLLVFSSILSTADTEIFLLSSILSRESTRWKGGYKSNRKTSTETSVKSARLAVLGVTLLSVVLSVYFSDIVDVYVFLLSVVLVITPPLVIGFFTTLPNRTVWVSIILSALTFAVLIGTGQLQADNLMLIVIPGAVITFLMKYIDRA